jgi:hypothetical protein
MRACILALGRYQRRLARYLDHPETAYAAVPEGTPLVVKIGHVDGEENVRALARLLCVDVENPATHSLGRHFRYEEHTFARDLARLDFMKATESAVTVWTAIDLLIQAEFHLFLHIER